MRPNLPVFLAVRGKARHDADMHLSTLAIICAVRAHAEHGAIVRVLTPSDGLLAGYVRGGRSRVMRPILMPSNIVQCEFRWRSEGQLAAVTAELVRSRAPLMAEPLAAAALDWATALTAATLPEGYASLPIHSALSALLDAIEMAPAARGWALALGAYEALLLSALGFGGRVPDMIDPDASWPTIIDALRGGRAPLERHFFEGRRADVLAARDRLVDRMKRAVA
jgi:DNA repair protein RecO (recombination protein O)